MRKTCLEMVHELARDDKRICFIGSDLGVGTLDEMKRELPERFFMEGISEANIVGMAAGMAMEGKIPYVNTIATFITRRCLEQVVLDLGLHNTRVRLIGNGGGLVYAPLGPTHEAIDDLALMRCIPGMTILAPADAVEMRRVMPLTVDIDGPVYIRLAKGHDPVVTEELSGYSVGKAMTVQEGKDLLIVTTGITLKLAQEASATLGEEGISVSIVHLPFVKPIDRETLESQIAGVKAVISIEEHSVIGGIGSALSEIIAEGRFKQLRGFKRMGIPDAFPDQYGSQNSLMSRYGIDHPTLVQTAKDLLNPRK